jgi:hypothetical protein
MLMGEFYHEGLKTVLATFSSLFNDIIIKRSTDFQDSTPDKEVYLRVPISFAQVDKMMARVRTVPEFNNRESIILPRMAVEMTGLQYDPTRKLNKINKVLTKNFENKWEYTWSPVPYNISIALGILTLNYEDCLQIVEQIVPFFQPDFNVQIIDLYDIKRDISFTLDSVDIQDAYDGAFEDSRLVTGNLSFTAKTHLYGPLDNLKVIKRAIVNTATPEYDCFKDSFFVDPFQAEREDPHVILSDYRRCENAPPITTTYYQSSSWLPFVDIVETASEIPNRKISQQNNIVKRSIYIKALNTVFAYQPNLDTWVPDTSSSIIGKQKIVFDTVISNLVGFNTQLQILDFNKTSELTFTGFTDERKDLQSFEWGISRYFTSENTSELNPLLTSITKEQRLLDLVTGYEYFYDDQNILNTNEFPIVRKTGNFIWSINHNKLYFSENTQKLIEITPLEIKNTVSSGLNYSKGNIVESFIMVQDSTELDGMDSSHLPILELGGNIVHMRDPITGKWIETQEYCPKPNSVFFDILGQNFWYVINDSSYARLT